MKEIISIKKPYIFYTFYDRKLKRLFKGVACCQPEDTWQENKGIRIAKKKAKINKLQWKINNSNSLKKFLVKFFNNELCQLEKRIEALNYRIEEENKELNKLIIN